MGVGEKESIDNINLDLLLHKLPIKAAVNMIINLEKEIKYLLTPIHPINNMVLKSIKTQFELGIKFI